MKTILFKVVRYLYFHKLCSWAVWSYVYDNMRPKKNVDKGGEIMTEEEQRRETVLRKLRRTGRGETVCLADWEVKLLLGYIDYMKRKAEKQK